MLVDWLVYGLLVFGLAKLLNATAFKQTPASGVAAWTLTTMLFLVSVFALSALKLLIYDAIFDDVGARIRPNNPLDVGGAFAFSWMFFSLLKRRAKGHRLAAADTSQAPSVADHSQLSSVPPTTGRSNETVRAVIIMIVAVCVVLPLIGIALRAGNQNATEAAPNVSALEFVPSPAPVIVPTPVAAPVAPDPAPTPPPLAQITAQKPQLDPGVSTDANAIQEAFARFHEIAKPYGTWANFTKHTDFQKYAADEEFNELFAEAFERSGNVVVGAKPSIAKAAAKRLAELMSAHKSSPPASTVASHAESVGSGLAQDAKQDSSIPLATAAADAADSGPAKAAQPYQPMPPKQEIDYNDAFGYFQRKNAQIQADYERRKAAIGQQIADVNKQNAEFQRSFSERYQYHLKEVQDEQARQGRFVAAYLPNARTEWSAIVESRLWLVYTSEIKANKYDDFVRNRIPQIAPPDAPPADVSALRSEFAKVFPRTR